MACIIGYSQVKSMHKYVESDKIVTLLRRGYRIEDFLEEDIVFDTIRNVSTVALVVGANDIPWSDAEGLLSSMQTLCQAIHEENPAATVIVCEILPRAKNRYIGARWTDIRMINDIASAYNTTMKEVEKRLTWLKFVEVDCFHTREGPRMLCKDGLHLSFEGTERVVECLERAIVKDWTAKAVKKTAKAVKKTTTPDIRRPTMDTNGRRNSMEMKKTESHCRDCRATMAKMYSTDDDQGLPEKKPADRPRRSFLPAPKSYSKIPAPSSTFSSPSPPVDIQPPKTQPIPIPQASTPGQYTTSDQADNPEFFIGDRICIGGIKTGTLLYFGTIHVAAGQWCGIALDEPEGIHDGLVNETRYFTCRKGHGIFAPVDKVVHLDKVTKVATKSAVKVSHVPSKTIKCKPVTSEEINYHSRSGESTDKSDDDLDDNGIEGLDEDGIIHDTDEEADLYNRERYTPRRKLPKLPKQSGHGISRLHHLRNELNDNKFDDNVEEAVEMMEDEDDVEAILNEVQPFTMEDKCEPELQHSAGGSSGGDDSWSLSKEFILGDGKQYLNITFDGESESKTSTQEQSLESPSPEFIFDQEMLEDGEFCAEPMQMSRDSSLGILNTLTLDRTDLLFDLGVDEEDIVRLASQETLEASTSEKRNTPDSKQEENTCTEMDSSVDFDDVNDMLMTSTPFVDRKLTPSDNVDLNETYTADIIKNTTQTLELNQNETFEIKIKNISIKTAMNSTFTKDEDDIDVVGKQNLNNTFTLADDEVARLKSEELSSKPGPNRGPLIDSGISLKGSLTESSIVPNTLKVSVHDSMKGSLVDSAIRGQMADSGIMVQSAMVNSVGIAEKAVPVRDNEGKDLALTRMGKTAVSEKDMIHADLDDRKLMSDLRKGHQRKERPVSFLSTTSADTGYAPDTDSEVGTLTLNSPQEWMDRGFHGNLEQSHDKNQTHEFPSERITRLEPIPIESDSDVGMTTGDTDNETDRAEIVHPVEADERLLSGVTMEDIQEDMAESEDEITQIEDIKAPKGLDGTFTADSTQVLDSTFNVPEVNTDQQDTTPDNGDSCETTDSVSMVTVVIEDKEEVEQMEKKEDKSPKKAEKKSAKKKKFNVVKDFKKPNINVVSKLSEYLKTPVPVKPKEDKSNKEEVKNKKNIMKAKIDLSKVTSKIDNKVVEEKTVNTVTEKKEKEVIKKEPVKKINRTPPKSKWDNIMAQIASKEPKEPKPKVEVKSKLEFTRIPPPAPPKKEEPPKPKKRISMGVPDYSKVQSKLKYSAPPAPPKPKKKENEKTDTPKPDSRNVSKNTSPARSVTNSPRRQKSESLNISPNRGKSESPARKGIESSPTRDKNGRGRKLSRDLERVRNLSGDSVKRPGIKDKALHIDLADTLDGRHSRTGTGSVISSRPSSVTDMSTTGAEDEAEPSQSGPLAERVMSIDSLRRDSCGGQSEVSEAGSQLSGKDVDADATLQSAESNQVRRKSGLLAPTSSLDSFTDNAGVLRPIGRAKILKPVVRQHSAPSPLTKPSMFTNKAPSEKTSSRRSRNQNRNKTSRSKKDKHDRIRAPETMLAEVHTREVHRLEALCEGRTKQLNLARLQLQNSNQAFDGMSTVVNHLANNLDAFSNPALVRKTEALTKKTESDQHHIEVLEKQRNSLEEIVQQLKEQHKEYVNNLERESEHSLTYQKESLDLEHSKRLRQVEEKRLSELAELKRSHTQHVGEMRLEYIAGQERTAAQHREEVRALQKKQENQMEELHKQHQDKLENITGRFDSIKLTLSEKVEDLRSECERLRNRARLCEEALQRDSDFKVQCALAPYKNLPKEIESLKMVVEMRNEEINKLKNHNIELQKKLEELPVAQEKIIGLNQKKENLEAIISMKTDHEKVLHERCQNLMRKYDKESRANKRLSMEYEELMYKLSESFEDSTEMGSQEALFYKKMAEGESPTPSRKLRNSSNLESPTKSPSYKRSVSSSVDDREEKKLKRRSGNFLLDERKHRPISPRDNPLAKSWSPCLETSPSPTRMHTSSPNRMSQSWCVDMEVGPDPGHSPIPKSRSDLGKERNGRRKKVNSEHVKSDENGDQVSVSMTNSPREESSSNGVMDTVDEVDGGHCVQEPSRSRRDTVTLEDSDPFSENCENNSQAVKNTSQAAENSPPSGGELSAAGEVFSPKTVNGDSRNTSETADTPSDKATVPTSVMTCPPSKLPTFTGSADRRQTEKSRGHRESAV